MRPNSYHIKHVIGRNFLKNANYYSSEDVAESFFKQGEDIMIKLIKTQEYKQNRAYSVHCYLYEKIRYLKKFKINVQNSELRQMYNFLKVFIGSDDKDFMARHINNYFFKFLKSIGKLDLVPIKLYKLDDFFNFLGKEDIRSDDLLDDGEFLK